MKGLLFALVVVLVLGCAGAPEAEGGHGGLFNHHYQQCSAGTCGQSYSAVCGNGIYNDGVRFVNQRRCGHPVGNLVRHRRARIANWNPRRAARRGWIR